MDLIIAVSIGSGAVLALTVFVARELRWHFPRSVTTPQVDKSVLEDHERRLVDLAEKISAHAMAIGLKELK